MASTVASMSGMGSLLEQAIRTTAINPDKNINALITPHSIVESRYARDYIPKFQAKFGVAEEEPDGPFQGLVQRYRQGFGYHVAGLQHPGADGAHPKGTLVKMAR